MQETGAKAKGLPKPLPLPPSRGSSKDSSHHHSSSNNSSNLCRTLYTLRSMYHSSRCSQPGEKPQMTILPCL